MKKPKLGMKRRKGVKTNAALVSTSVLLPEYNMPLMIKPNVNGMCMYTWAEKNGKQVEQWLHNHGAVLFRGFQVNEGDEFRRLVTSLGCSPLPYKEQSSPRHEEGGKNVYTSTDYPPQYPIFLHNENSYQAAWPMKLFFYCHVAPGEGGATPIADCRRLYAKIPQDIIERFRERGIMYMRNYGDKLGLPWQRTFQTDNRDEVEAHCAKSGLRVEWKEDGGLRTRAVRKLVTEHPETGESVWFNHATFFHVSTREQEVQDSLASLPEEDLPTQSYYGDGSSIEPEVLETIRKVYNEEELSFPWEKGDILMIDNMLCAHGRAPYGGSRKILVAMADPVVAPT